MSHSPLISVVCPIHSLSNQAEEALSSVFDQTYANIELLLLIEEHFSEDSVQWLESTINKLQLARPKIAVHLVRHAEKSLSGAINYGLTFASGEYLTILDTRDKYHPQRFSQMLSPSRQAPLFFAFSRVCAMDENSALPPEHLWRKSYEKMMCYLVIAPTLGFYLLRENLALTAGNFIFSRSLYEQVGKFKEFKEAYDLDFILRALLVVEPIFVDEELYYYRPFARGQSSSKELKKELQAIYAHYLVDSAKHPPKNKLAPCHWYWPGDFAKLRQELKMDEGLVAYLTKPTPAQTEPILAASASKPGASSKKVTLVSHELSLTGAPKVVADLALSLKNHGFRPNVISLKEGPMRAELEAHQISVYVLPKWVINLVVNKKKAKIRKYIGLSLMIPLVFFRTAKTTIMNTVVTWPLMLSFSYLFSFRNYIWYIHDSLSPIGMIPTGIPSQLLGRLRQKTENYIWFGSDQTRQFWNQSAGLNGQVMYWSGISVAHTSKRLAKPHLRSILSVGTSSPRKGTNYLIDAFILAVKEKQIPEDVILTIVGFPDKIQDTFVGDLILKVIQAGLQGRIRMISSIQPSQLDKFYEEADLFVQSSVLECLPLSLLKAMSLGLPVVTTNVNGCVEAICHKETGYVCQSRNIESLSEAIAEAILNPEQSVEFGKRAQKVFNEQFSLEATEKKVLNRLEAIDR